MKRGVRVPAAAGSPLSASLSAIRSQGDSDARWAGTCLSSRRADAQAFRGSYLESVTYCAGGEKRAWLELAASVLAVHSRTFPLPMGERTHWRYRQAQGRCDVVRFSLGPTQGLACRLPAAGSPCARPWSGRSSDSGPRRRRADRLAGGPLCLLPRAATRRGPPSQGVSVLALWPLTLGHPEPGPDTRCSSRLCTLVLRASGSGSHPSGGTEVFGGTQSACHSLRELSTKR